MSPQEIAAIIRLLDGAVTVAINAGIAVDRYLEMRELSGGHLTDDQVQALADAAEGSVMKLGARDAS